MKTRKLISVTFVAFLLAVTQKLDAGTVHPALLGPSRFLVAGDSVDVWVLFTDRGFADQAALHQALVRVEQNLLPHARQRRLKMHRPSLVEARDLPLNADYVRSVLDVGARFRAASRYINAVSVRAPQDKLRAIAALPSVAQIRPVAKGWRDMPLPDWTAPPSGVRQPCGVDLLNYGPSFDQLNQINVVAAHDSGYSGAGVLVCLLDTGFFLEHEALVNQPVLAQWDFINNDSVTQNQPGDPPDQDMHGTYTFSTLGGAHDGDLYGPAYGATFVLGKTENVASETPIEEDYYVAGLEWADSLGADVVSTSLGYFDWYTFEDLDGNTCVTTIGVDNAVANGIVCVTAAGNERGTSWGHIIAPADADSVNTVGAVNSAGILASFSSPGPTYDGRIKPDVCARGVNTWCAAPWGSQPATNYAGVSGTSLSTPLVGGSCALVLEAHPNWTPMQVLNALRATASNAMTPDNDYGWGIINVMAAINYSYGPVILQRHPDAGTVIVYQDSLQVFWISAQDPNGGSLTYQWWADSTLMYTGPDSQFIHAWSSLDTVAVKVIVADHNGSDSTFWTVQIEPYTSVQEPSPEALPEIYALHNGFPNPFNARTSINFDLPVAGPVRLAVYNVSGRQVSVLRDSWMSAGRHQQVFDTSGLASGIYFCRLTAGRFNAAIKLVYAQ